MENVLTYMTFVPVAGAAIVLALPFLTYGIANPSPSAPVDTAVLMPPMSAKAAPATPSTPTATAATRRGESRRPMLGETPAARSPRAAWRTPSRCAPTC